MGSLGFVLGTAATDHQQVLLDQLVDQLKGAPQEDTFFYIVPNHIKFETEVNVMTGLRQRLAKDGQERFASSRVQVLSFSRLAWFLLRDTPIFRQTRLSKVGMAMLTTKVVQEHVDELRLFASEARQAGFIQKLTDQLAELQAANISADDLSTILKKIQADSQASRSWLAKMHDVAVIYHAYEEKMAGHFLGNTALYQQLAEYLTNQQSSKHMHFFLDRFTQFTAGEQELVNAIILNAVSTSIAFTLDRGYPDQQHPNASELPDPNDLFYTSAMQYHRLWKFANSHPHQVKLIKNVTMATNPRVTPALQEVDRFFKRYAREPLDLTAGHQLVDRDNLQFVSSTNRLGELNNVATMIRQMVATGKYRYKDFLILSRHLAPYQSMLAPVFAAHQIPIFNDHERQMDKHPLVTLLTTLLNIPLYGYRAADIIQLLKTWLLLPASDELDITEAVFTTENWCLKQAIDGKGAWTTTDKDKVAQLWRVQEPAMAKGRAKKTNAQLDLIRNFVKDRLVPFFDSLKKVQTGRELATKLYQFLVTNGVTDRLQEWQTYQADRAHNLDLAQQPKQVWATFCQILQEYVGLLGDTPVGDNNRSELLTNFSGILQAGFAAAQYSQIPATLDQVIVSETGIVQGQDHRVVFMIGSTDDVMPEVHEDDGLLTDSDKDILSQYLDHDYQYLPPTAVDQLAAEPFLNYQGFMSARERLILTAPQLASDDQELTASRYLVDMARYFQVPWRHYPLVTSREGLENASQFVSAPLATASQLVQAERQLADDQGVKAGQQPVLPTSWRQVVGALHQLAKHDDQVMDRLALIEQGFAYRNQTGDLSPQMAQALYLHTSEDNQRELYASISQLQDFYINQYEYFLKYGLRLQKRDELAMSNDRIGTYFHKAMEEFVKTVMGQGLKFKDLNQPEHQQEFNACANQALTAADQLQPGLLRLTASSGQARFQYQQLTTIVTTMFKTLCHQDEYAGFTPWKTEIQFGRVQDKETSFAALSYPLHNNGTIKLRGRIDRIDKVKPLRLPNGQEKQYLAVVDYKSGDRTFDLTSAYYGISLQLLTYLNGLQKNLAALGIKDADLAGALYLHLNNPTINADKLGQVSSANASKRLAELKLKSHQYKGILLSEPQALLEQLDSSLADQSFLYPLTENRSGQIKEKKGALLANQSQLDWLREQNRQLIINAGNTILSGKVALNPYRLVDGQVRKTGLDYTDYLDIYQFDSVLDQGLYRQLDPRVAKDAFDEAKTGQDHDQEGRDDKQ